MKRKRSSFDSAEAKQARSSHSPGSEAATASSPAAACPAPTVVIPDDDEEDNDDDIVIDETKSTPKPKAPTFDISRVKTERRTTEVPGFHMECSDDAAPEVPEPVSTPAAETSAAISTREPPSPEQGQVSTTTQTETGVAIKEENEEMKNTAHNQEENGRKDAEVERTEVGTSSLARENARVDANKAAASAASQMEVESAKEGCSASPQGNEARESREGAGSEMEVTESREAEPRTGGDGGKVSAVPPREQVPVENVLIEAQQQQDQLMELMEKTATERDAYQNEVHQLIVKVEDLEQNMLELTQKSVKKEQNHRASQTDDPESEGDSKSLRQQIEQLRKERDALAEEKRQWEEKNKGEGSSRKSPQKERKADEGSCSSQVNVVDDELALQVDFLLRELDQSNVERDELKTKLASLEVERAGLASRMEQLRKELVELKGAGNRSPAGPAEGQSAAVGSGQKETASGSSRQAQANGSREERQNGIPEVMETETQEEGRAQANCQTNGSPGRQGKEEKYRLSELRRSVGRLLVTFVPALDLNQVNYECSVIDEILDQVLQEISQSENGIDAT